MLYIHIQKILLNHHPRAHPEDFKSTKKADSIWEVIYPEVRANGDNCAIDIEQGATSLSLNDIVFGDVWFCSGQSNMDRPMSYIYNATEEIEDSAIYTNIRGAIQLRSHHQVKR